MMLTTQYKPGYYIHFCDMLPHLAPIAEYTAQYSPSGYGGETIGKFKSERAAKIAITKHIKARELQKFINGYITCALWSSHDESNESGGQPLDENYNLDDIAPQTLDSIKEDCTDFVQSNRAALLQYCKAYNPRQGYDVMECAGHDFWLTRSGHGTGFWDRGLGALGDKLTQAAKIYNGVDLYVGDDGKIYA